MHFPGPLKLGKMARVGTGEENDNQNYYLPRFTIIQRD